MKGFTVSRLNIVECLCEITTPSVVIGQCMASHGYESNAEAMRDVKYRKKCIDKLTCLAPLSVKDPRRAVRYINNQTTFINLENVERAMEFLFKAEKLETSDIDIHSMVHNRCYGPITEDAPEKLDCTVLYRLIRRRGLHTRPEYDTEELFRLFTMDFHVPVRRLRDFFIEEIMGMTSVDLLNNLYPLVKEKIKDPTLPMEELYAKHIAGSATPLSDPLRLRMPATEHEAVLLAAKNFKIDISESGVPLLEYAVLLTKGSRDRSFPIDSELQNRIQRDTHSLNLSQRFNPSLPDYVYSAEDVKRMATEEGWNTNMRGELENPYRFLRVTHHKNTFFAFGKGPMATVKPVNSELLIELESVSEHTPANIVLFGNRSNISEMQALSWIELTQTFENYREFRNPLGNSYHTLFDDFSINKLIILAKKPCIDQLVSDRRKRLVLVIESIRLDNEKKMQYLETVKRTLNAYQARNTSLQSLLEGLYRMALAMRSFRENELFSDDITSGGLDGEETQLAVSLEAIKLDGMLKECDSWVRDIFLNLPLVIYYPKENKFSTSESNFEGHTIGGRLSIVHMGENTSAVSSCMRLSSNWFMSSVFYYQRIFGFPIRFDVTRLRHIG
jgi:hypothetical protein